MKKCQIICVLLSCFSILMLFYVLNSIMDRVNKLENELLFEMIKISNEQDRQNQKIDIHDYEIDKMKDFIEILMIEEKIKA